MCIQQARKSARPAGTMTKTRRRVMIVKRQAGPKRHGQRSVAGVAAKVIREKRIDIESLKTDSLTFNEYMYPYNQTSRRIITQ